MAKILYHLARFIPEKKKKKCLKETRVVLSMIRTLYLSTFILPGQVQIVVEHD